MRVKTKYNEYNAMQRSNQEIMKAPECRAPLLEIPGRGKKWLLPGHELLKHQSTDEHAGRENGMSMGKNAKYYVSR
jgi:hypothetical protein